MPLPEIVAEPACGRLQYGERDHVPWLHWQPSLEEAAPLFSAGLTVQKALKSSGIRTGAVKRWPCLVSAGLAELLELASRGGIPCRYETQPLANAADALDRMKRAEITGRGE